jgi:MoaA/NifB/PqqE/SkfB family radical SAM enzyme
MVYCTAPWNGITIREDGNVLTCCSGQTSLGNLNQDPIDKILESPTLKQIQQGMINGDPDRKNCTGCMSLENTGSGLAQLRQHYLKKYPSTNNDTTVLRSLDVRWNTTCNLACLYCGPHFSSTWSERLSIKPSAPVKSYQDDVLAFILEQVNNVEEIMLVGGEPMLMKQNYVLLSQLSPNARVSIITNLSYDLERLPCMPALLSRPRSNTIWNVSCENIKEQFEYVRSGGSWELLEKNLKFLVKHWPDDVSISLVYSLFTAFDLPKTIQYFHQLGIKKFNFQPYYNVSPDSKTDHLGDAVIDVFMLPTAMQHQALQCLIEASKIHYENIHVEDRDFFPLQNIDSVISKLNNPQPKVTITKKQFFDRINWYDQWSTKRFQDLWPHVVDLVQLHLV